MKKILIFMFLLLWSCEPGHILVPPYQSEWTITNNTGCNLDLYMEITSVNAAHRVYTDIETYVLPDKGRFWQEFLGDRAEQVEFLDLYSRLEQTTACRVYLTPSDSDEILKEWVMGADNGEHDLFDESQWEHRSWERPQSYYTIYHNAWTFTLTEADIAVAE
ncbi:MAG: hypothetical protein J6V28_04700 [Tidjanibacter sp.]|nr:hypothetical protein [Tidjanibacter sp.]